MLLHASDLVAWGRCAAQYGYRRAGLASKTNSAAAYGSVMHVAIEVLERRLWELRPLHPNSTAFRDEYARAVDEALATFWFYWHPHNIDKVCEPVPPDGWLPRTGYAELRQKGAEAIRQYADLRRTSDDELLALEYAFVVPLHGTWDEVEGGPHYLGGTVDRLAIKHYSGQPTVGIDDFKTSMYEPRFLRHNLQFTAYSYASLQPEFWVGSHGEEGFGPKRGQPLYERTKLLGRRSTWISLQKVKFIDAGVRGDIDYRRLALAIEQLAASVRADIFPLSISGENCRWCEFRSICGGTGIATEER